MPGMTPTTADAEQGGRGERRKDGDAGKGGKEATCAPPAAPKNWRCAVPVVSGEPARTTFSPVRRTPQYDDSRTNCQLPSLKE